FNRTLTAEALAISRKTLFNKMKRYGLSTDEI
ncbi:helix-turn-helix domain-containing protein, partial [Parabacteroides goldsteinii]